MKLNLPDSLHDNRYVLAYLCSCFEARDHTLKYDESTDVYVVYEKCGDVVAGYESTFDLYTAYNAGTLFNLPTTKHKDKL